jgi:hypothetical protein
MNGQTTGALKPIKEFFGYEKLTDFGKDWRELSAEDKQQIRSGIENGTFTY